jgi:CheY-like chemotaxis protein
MSTSVYIIIGLAAIGSVLVLRILRQTRRQLAHYRRLAERQGVIAESLFTELAAVRSDLAWLHTRHDVAGRLSSETTWEWRMQSGELIFSNPWKAALGYDQADLPPALATLELVLHPDDRQQVIGQLQHFALATAPILELHYRLRHRDGHYLCFECRALRTTEPDGKSETLLAVQRAVRALPASPAIDPETRAAALLFRDGPLALVEWDGDGTIWHCNDRAASLLGWSRSEPSEPRFYDLFSEPEGKRLRSDCEGLSAGGCSSRALVTRTGAGVAVVLHWITLARRGTRGDRSGFVSVGLEPAAPVHASYDHRGQPGEPDPIGLLHDTLQSLAAPLTTIAAQTRAALRETLPPKPRKHLENIGGAATRIQSILDKLLAVSGDGRDHHGVAGNAFVLDQRLIDSCDALLQPCRAKGIALRLQVAPEVPQDLAGDSTQLGQVLAQLLDNAVKYTRRGSITIAVGLGQRRGARVKLEFGITDTGTGLDSHQADSLSKDRLPPGLSVGGFAVARHLVRHLGGKINLESTPGRGTRVSFSAWFECRADRPAYLSTLPATAGACRALVVHPDADIREDLAAQLARMGLRADAVDAAERATALVEAADADPYRLVVLGWQPPVLDGIALAARLRSMACGEGGPWLVIVAGAGAGLQDVESAIGDLPVDGVLIMPITGLHLANLLAGLFAQPPQGPAHRLMTPPSRDLAGLRILLVEDSDTSQLIATELLRDMGAEVTVAGSGPEAYTLLAGAADGSFDAVLMDIEMPEMDGIETCRRIRNAARFAQLPVIALTGHRLDEAAPRYLASGINDFIPKPLNPQHLYNVLAHWTQPQPHPARHEPPSWPGATSGRHPVYTRLRGINTAIGLEYMSNKPALYEKVLKEFHARFKHATVDMRDALARGDYDSARRQIHALKSLAGSIGAAELSAAAVDLESALVESAPPASGVLEALEEALAEVLGGLQQQFLTD